MARMRYAPLKREKHEITWSNLGQDASAVKKVVLVKGVASADADLPEEVTNRHKVRGIYVEFNLNAATTGAINILHWNVVKAPFGTTMPIPSLYNQTSKRFVLKRGMEMIPANITVVTKRIFVVPLPNRGTIGDDDQVIFQYVTSGTDTINNCGIAVYKETF